MFPAVLVLLQLPRPFRKVRGELPVLSDLPSDGYTFFAVLPALTAAVALRRSSSPALLRWSFGLDAASVCFTAASRIFLSHSRVPVHHLPSNSCLTDINSVRDRICSYAANTLFAFSFVR
jgi:hypothetical protein